jgi:purine-binding chemotaxis protein CheW
MLHVVFRVGDADYVVPASDVVQMESFDGATRVPGAAPFVAGLVQVRGRVVPVVDLRTRFGAPPAERTLDTRIVVVRDGERPVALLVDRAREVIEVPEDAFEPPPPVVAAQAAGFVRAVARVGSRLLLSVDVPKVVGPEPLPEEDSHGE